MLYVLLQLIGVRSDMLLSSLTLAEHCRVLSCPKRGPIALPLDCGPAVCVGSGGYPELGCLAFGGQRICAKERALTCLALFGVSYVMHR